MKGLLRKISFAALSVAAKAGVSFITVGDWGGAALEEPSKPYSQNVRDVAAQMERSANEHGVQFIVNTGDNFYWCGIQNSSDFQVTKDWLEPYAASSLQVPWYGVLGNHEYAYNVDAQIDLSSKYENWVLPGRYYTKRIQLDASHYASFIFIDSSPCVAEYRADNPSRWDPCSTEFPTCSLSGGTDEFEGSCEFNKHILTQDCSAQHDWFKQELAAVPEDDWLIVVGHHPAEEIDVEDFTTTMQAHGFDLFLNGHTHCLTHYTIDGTGNYVTSGAGSLVVSRDQLGGSPAKDRTYNKVHNLNAEMLANASLSSSHHSYRSVFHKRVSGFTLHTFSDDYTTLTTDFLDTDGNVMHSFTATRGKGPAPGPSPSPPGPSPSPSSGCCYHRDQACTPGQTCCSGSGKSYASESACSRYGAEHSCTWDGTECVVGPATVVV